VFAVTFGISAALLSIVFGSMAFAEIDHVRQLKKKNADIEERYRQVRNDMLRELDRRHQVEQVLRASAPVATTITSPTVGTYTVGATFAPGTSNNVFPLDTSSSLGAITLRVSSNTTPAGAPPPPDQNHFARIAVPRRFLRLD
jgi:hypothetical protein